MSNDKRNLNVNTKENVKDKFVGGRVTVPVYRPGKNVEIEYVNFDNGASTPALKSVAKVVEDFLPYYSGVHRGTGFKSQLSTHAFEESRHGIMEFVGANHQDHCVIFSKNTTESVNKLARRFPYTEERDIVITTSMEHHSSDLPFRAFAPKTLHVGLLPDGSLDIQDLENKLKKFGKRVALVSITAASNVLGTINPIHEIAIKVHRVGAYIYVDCAQIIAHRKVDMLPLDDPAHIDFIAFSGHKMYAPYGTGALVGRKDIFSKGDPDMPGGGTVNVVTQNKVMWAPAPERDEAGSPNVVGAVATYAAILELQKVGMSTIECHEIELTSYAIRKLKKVKGITLYGSPNPEFAYKRVGVVTFNLEGIPFGKVASILSCEFGIGVRAGCFCAQVLVGMLMKSTEQAAEDLMERIKMGENPERPGMVRASFGMYNTFKDVDALYDALCKIVSGEYKGTYVRNPETGDYDIQGWKMTFDRHFEVPTLAGANKLDRNDSAYSSPSDNNNSSSENEDGLSGHKKSIELRRSIDRKGLERTIALKKQNNRSSLSQFLDWKSYKPSQQEESFYEDGEFERKSVDIQQRQARNARVRATIDFSQLKDMPHKSFIKVPAVKEDIEEEEEPKAGQEFERTTDTPRLHKKRSANFKLFKWKVSLNKQ